MRLGTGILLLALGAVLAFAVNVQLSGVDLRVVGWILMVAGALAVVLDLVLWAPRRRRVVRTDSYPPAAGAPAPRRTTTDETY